MSSFVEPSDLVEMFYKKFAEDPIRFDNLLGSTATWDSTKLVKLYSMKEYGDFTHEEMASELGLERSTITRKLQNVDWDAFGQELLRLCTISDDQYKEEAASNFRTEALAKIAVRHRKSDISIKAQMRHLEQCLINSTAPIPREKLPPLNINTKRRKKKTAEHMVLLLSDMHIGLEFDKYDTGGLNEFNLEICKRRANNLRHAIIDIYRLHAELYPIPTLHVLALGDNVQGGNDVGEWGCAYNSTLALDEQAIKAADITSEMLNTWSEVFENVEFMGVIGNHGRAGKKNVEKVRANWDNMVFALIKGKMSEHDNVKVEYSPAWWAIKDINGTGFCLVHGDDMRSSINQLVSEEQRIQSLLASQDQGFDVMVAGHFHTHHEHETSKGRIIINGSFIGGDMYSMKKMRVRSRPTQTLFGVHPEHGITWKYCIDLDHPRP